MAEEGADSRRRSIKHEELRYGDGTRALVARSE